MKMYEITKCKSHLTYDFGIDGLIGIYRVFFSYYLIGTKHIAER